MKNLIILGAGGLGREIAWLVEEINGKEPEWNLLGYLDSHPSVKNENIITYPVIGKFEDYIKFRDSYFIVAFGDPRYRKEVVEIVDSQEIKWATLISPTVYLHNSNKIGKGVVIGRNSDLTIDCVLEDHSMLNIHVVLGHKVRIGKYSIISPNVTLTGEARIGECCSIGANAFVRDVNIADYVTVGASSCVTRNIDMNCVVVGVPAKVIRQGAPINRVTKSLREIDPNL